MRDFPRLTDDQIPDAPSRLKCGASRSPDASKLLGGTARCRVPVRGNEPPIQSQNQLTQMSQFTCGKIRTSASSAIIGKKKHLFGVI